MTRELKPSSDCLALVKHFEGFFQTAYKDPVGVWTIGYGHTGLTHLDGTVYKGRKISEAEGDSLLAHDLAQFSSRVNHLVSVQLRQCEFDALVSFDFNTGGLAKSTLLKRLNNGDRAGAANELLRWDRAGGRRMAGLARRRASERKLFLGERPFIIPSGEFKMG